MLTFFNFSLNTLFILQPFDKYTISLITAVSELNDNVLKCDTLGCLERVSLAQTYTGLFFLFGLLTAAKHWQFSFQTPHNDAMFWIIDLHADIMVFLVFVVGLVLALILGIILPYYYTKTTKVKVNLDIEAFSSVEFIDLKIHNHNSFYEMIWTVIPILLEFFIILPSFIVHYAVSQTHPYYIETKGITTAHTIRVIGNQWYWVYQIATLTNLSNWSINNTLPITVIESYLINPEESESGHGLRMLEVDQQLFLTAGKYYKILVTSDDVIHSWAIPALNVKIDACPGRLNDINLQIKDAGIYYGQCSEICGYYHGNMPIMLVAKK